MGLYVVELPLRYPAALLRGSSFVKINVENKTYKLFLDCITEYKDIINKKYELKITN